MTPLGSLKARRAIALRIWTLTIRWPYCFTESASCVCVKYCTWALARAVHAAIAASSFLPMQRDRISSLPASVSNCHAPADFSSSEIGKRSGVLWT